MRATEILATDIMLTPATAEQPDHVVYVTDHGFEPAVVTARPGDIVQWVNADLAEHSIVRSGAWDSGVLRTGASYTVKLGGVGEYTYDDGANPANRGFGSVSDTSTTSIGQIFLPLVTR